MSLAGAKAAIAAELANVTWVVPASAAPIPYLGERTSFLPASIFTYEGQQEFSPKEMPIARILVPSLEELRITSGADGQSQKLQTLYPQVYVLFAVDKQYSQGGHELMDAILDGILAYFRRHSGAGGTATGANNDVLVSAGLRQKATVDPVVVADDPDSLVVSLSFRGMVSPAIQMAIV